MTWRILVLTLLAGLAAVGHAPAQPPEITGTQQQQALVVQAAEVDAATREAQGLLTLTTPEGRCSASMLNDYWAVTAAHCVYSRATNCPLFAANQIQLTANWPRNHPASGWINGRKTVQARQVIAYGTPRACVQPDPDLVGTPSDIALLQVGLHDFGRSDVRQRKLEDRRPQSNASASAFGRGINTLAFMQDSTPMPTTSDGLYRSVEFAITDVSDNEYSFFGGAGAVIAGGDSGGPTLIEDWDNPLSPQRRLEWRLIGVHSRCTFDCLPSQSCTGTNTWRWVSQVNQCWDASVLPVRSQILAAIEAVPPDGTFVGTFGPVPPEVLARKRALYAMNLDEPLVAPAGAAIDVQLTFADCHSFLRVSRGCEVEERYETWSYDPASHRILHVQSGKCLNISGGNTGAGAWIILYPCSGAPNEKWTMTGTSVVSFRSDHSGLCLHAAPGRPGRRTATGFTLPIPATLTQMPCDGSLAQQFNNVDSDWARRNGPR